MSEPVYRSRVHIQKFEGPLRHAYIRPFDDEAVKFGVHSGIADFYGAETAEPLPATLDYVVAAAGG